MKEVLYYIPSAMTYYFYAGIIKSSSGGDNCDDRQATNCPKDTDDYYISDIGYKSKERTV